MVYGCDFDLLGSSLMKPLDGMSWDLGGILTLDESYRLATIQESEEALGLYDMEDLLSLEVSLGDKFILWGTGDTSVLTVVKIVS